jgi:hypothetical protein
MKNKIYFGFSLLFLTSTCWSQQGNWQTCQYEPNPQQCMQGVPVNQQVAPSSLPMQPSFSQGGTTSQGRQITPPLNNTQQIPTYQYNQPMNCRPNGYGGFICQ